MHEVKSISVTSPVLTGTVQPDDGLSDEEFNQRFGEPYAVELSLDGLARSKAESEYE